MNAEFFYIPLASICLVNFRTIDSALKIGPVVLRAYHTVYHCNKKMSNIRCNVIEVFLFLMCFVC